MLLQGIQGHGYYDSLCIPIIENTARECELTASLREAILKYPNTQAVLVRRHGVYVWGKDWIQAKTQVGCSSCSEYAHYCSNIDPSTSRAKQKASWDMAAGGVAVVSSLCHARCHDRLPCLQAECYDYLFEAAVRMRGLGIDASLPPAGAFSCSH